MTLPGNRVPDHEGNSSIPAENVEQASQTMWCRHSVSWSFVADEGGWVCDFPDHYQGAAAAVELGKIPVGHQPMYTYPPNTNTSVQKALDIEDAVLAEQARQEHARRITRGY